MNEAAKQLCLRIAEQLQGLAEIRRLAQGYEGVLRVHGDRRRAFVTQGQSATPSDTISLGLAVEAACKVLGIANLQLSDDPFESLNSFERIVSRRCAFMTALAPVALPRELSCSELLEVALQELHRTTADSQFKRAEIVSEDGVRLAVFEAGTRGNPPLVLVIPAGMPVDIAAGWFHALGEHYHVITWEQRGILEHSVAFDDCDHSFDVHVRDLLAVMKYYSVQRADMLCVCVGALTGLRAAALHPERFKTLVLGNGAYWLGAGHPQCDFERNLERMVQGLALGRKLAVVMRRVMLAPRALSQLDNDLVHLTMLPYASAESLYRYALTVLELTKTDLLSWIDKVKVKTLVIVSERDEVVHPGAARVVHARLQEAALHSLSEGSHHALLMGLPDVANIALRFFANQTL